MSFEGTPIQPVERCDVRDYPHDHAICVCRTCGGGGIVTRIDHNRACTDTRCVSNCPVEYPVLCADCGQGPD
jgi:hypothetical protein